MEKLYYELSSAAADQLGLVTRAQAIRLGADTAILERLTAARLLTELDNEVFQLPSSATAPRFAYPYAAWLALAPELFRWQRPQLPTQDAVLSHESAARLHGLGVTARARTVFTAPQTYTTPDAVVVHVDVLAPDEVTVLGGVPVTTPQRTVLDLLGGDVDEDDASRVLADAVRRDLVDLGEIHRAVAARLPAPDAPAGGTEFLDQLLPDLVPSALSARNLRAYAELTAPETVAAVQARITAALSDFEVPDGEALHHDVAAQIVGRRARPGQRSR
ncbi:hypothetical protein [Nocardia callitridis]|uniref:AbiEi antitoxin C-terminal domain-containing protein n=1 Tax=Nocardia callitridis TaxID=648753 RepID=A0ABP9KGL4_9NOCA